MDEGYPEEAGAAADEDEDPKGDGADDPPLVPQPVTGLLPGNAVRMPSVCSLTDDGMLHEVLGH